MALNRNYDGPFAYSDRAEMAAFESTQWHIDAVYEHAADGGSDWSDFDDADEIIDSYRCGLAEGEQPQLDPGNVGRSVLALHIAGLHDQADAMMGQWKERIFESVDPDIDPSKMPPA